MGSSASTRKNSSAKQVGGPSSPNEVNPGGPLVAGQSKPLTKDDAVVRPDEIDGGPGQQNAIASQNPKGKVDAQNVAIQQEGTIDDASRTLPDISDILIADSVAAKAKRIEEFSDEVRQCLTLVKASIKHIHDCECFPCISCLQGMLDIKKVSETKQNDKSAVADGFSIDTDYCKMFAYTWTKGDMLQTIEDADQQEELSQETRQMLLFYLTLLDSTFRLSANSEYFCLQMEEDGCLSLIVDWFVHLEESCKAMNKWVDDMTFDGMSTLYNACRSVPSLVPKHHQAVPALEKFGESKDSLTQAVAVMTLAKLVKKEQASYKLSTNNTCIVTLLSLLNKCLSNPDHKANATRQSSKQIRPTVITVDVEDLVESVDDLAINDKNKRLIVEQGGIPILAKLLQQDWSMEAKTSAANGIWRLAFRKKNREKLREEQSIIYNLTENSYCKNEKLRNACKGAIFEIYESRLPEGPSHREKYLQSAQRVSSDSAKSSGHVMLSYKWEQPSKRVMQEFKKQLYKRGYSVWMDEDRMMGDTIDAMVEAVENADIVIACITRGYQQSQDCRSELVHAKKRKKKIIPVKVSADFKASGWLDFIVADKMYYTVPQAELVSKELSIIIEKEFAV